MTLRRCASRSAIVPSLLSLSLLSGALVAPVGAQTTIQPPATRSEAVATAGNPTRTGTPVVVVAAIDTSGDAETARQALRAANAALAGVPGYSPLAASEYKPLAEKLAKGATSVDFGYPFTATDFQKIGKASKLSRAMTIQVSPQNGGYQAVAEMYDTARGALVGYGRAQASGEEALEAAIADAVAALGRTATIGGIIISMPGNYTARLSLGTLSGARGGARVEYLGAGGEPIAFGTIFDIAAGESVATIAPETAYPDLMVNTRVRLVTNPVAKRALRPFSETFEREYQEFERSFGVAAVVAAAGYAVYELVVD